jgi:hypothetical protein
MDVNREGKGKQRKRNYEKDGSKVTKEEGRRKNGKGKEKEI